MAEHNRVGLRAGGGQPPLSNIVLEKSEVDS